MFNLLVGRELQGMMGQKPQQCFLMPILVGTDGVQKMSKSLSNYVAVEEPPNDMYGKLMSLPDTLIAPYFEYLTDIPDEELAEISRQLESDGVNPMEFKKRLAREITATFYDPETAAAAQENFERVVQRREIPEEIPEVHASPEKLADLSRSEFLVYAGLASSNSEAKRLLRQNAVKRISDSGETEVLDRDSCDDLDPGNVIKVGRRRFVRLVE